MSDNITVYHLTGEVERRPSGSVLISETSATLVDQDWRYGEGDLIGTFYQAIFYNNAYVAFDVSVPPYLYTASLDIWKTGNKLKVGDTVYSLFSGTVGGTAYPLTSSARMRVAFSPSVGPPRPSVNPSVPHSLGDDVRWVQDNSGSYIKDKSIRPAGFVLTPYSSSQHEVTRLNAQVSGAYYYSPEASSLWNTISGRTTSSNVSQYTANAMFQPTPVFGGYYSKNELSGGLDRRFRKLIYVLNSTTTGSFGSPATPYWNPLPGRESTSEPIEPYGKLVNANSQDTFQAFIPVLERGKIRDIKVWVELVSRARELNDTKAGLKGLQLAVVSPNVRGRGAYPIWNMPGAADFLYDANPNVTGVDGLIGRGYSNTQPEVFSSGAFVLWDGHVNTVTDYATTNLNLQGNWSEFDRDLDMRTIFSDNSPNDNPRSRRRVFPNATDGSPGAAASLQNTLVSSAAGFQPLNYYYSPSNYAMRNYSGTFLWNGPSVTVTGGMAPWFVDPRLSQSSLSEIIIGPPPDGWVTGDPNGLFLPWSGQSGPSGTIVGVTTGALTQSFASGQSSFVLDSANISGVIVPGENIRIIDQNTSLYHDAVITLIDPNVPNITKNRITFSPNTSIPLSGSSKVYLQSYVSMSVGTALVSGDPWTLGYSISAQRQYDPPGWIKVYATDNSFIFRNSGGPAGNTPVAGDVIRWANRYFKVLLWTDNVYIQDPGEETAPEGPFEVIYFDYFPGQGALPDTSAYSIGSGIAYATTASFPSTTPDNILQMLYSLGNRWGFSYCFVPPNYMLLVGGYTGSVSSPVAGNFVDVIYFSGTSISGAFRTGTISNAAGDGGTKTNRNHGGLFSINLGPQHSATFYMLVGGGTNTTLAITESLAKIYSTASVASVSWSNPYAYQYWLEDTTLDGQPYQISYYANVHGFTKVKVNHSAETASWVDGETVNIGSPVGTSFTFRISSTLFTDDQPTQTMTTIFGGLPYTSQAFPRSHPKAGKGQYTSNSQGGDAFGIYAVSDLGIYGNVTNRDTIMASDEFFVESSNLYVQIASNPKIYNTNHLLGGAEAINLTSSWRNIFDTSLLGTGVGNAFCSVTSSNGNKIIIYSFGGELSGPPDEHNYVQFCTASTSNSGLKLDISPWFLTDNNRSIWCRVSTSAQAFDGISGGVPLGTVGSQVNIPLTVGIRNGSAAVDRSTNTLFFGGGQHILFVGSTDVVYGSQKIYGWNYDQVTGLLTGTGFVAGEMPRGRMRHEMFVANGFLYCVGGSTGTYVAGSPTQVTETFYAQIDRALILQDGRLADWSTSLYDIPYKMSMINTGTGIVDGAAFIYPDDGIGNDPRYIHLIGGLKQFYNGTAYVSRSSAQSWAAQLNFTGSAADLPNQHRLGVDREWMGPASGEQLVVGAQLGPPDIKPVFPLLDDIYQQLVVSATPGGSVLPEGKTFIGYRPGLRNTEVFGNWQFRIATAPGAFDPNGTVDIANWAALTSSQVYVRQLRIEFLVDSTSGYSDLQYFNPARERLYRKSAVGFRSGKKLIDIISGSQWWDAGVSYIYAYQQPEYGRTVGITTNSSSDDYAVFTQLTGALSVHLTGTPSWFLNPPPGEGMPGLPYIPLSSATFGEAAQPIITTGSAAAMMGATVDQQLPIPSDNTLPAYLSRIQALRKTQDLFEEEISRTSSGSYF